MAAIIMGAWMNFPVSIQFFAACIGLDLLTGLLRSGIQGKLSSAIGTKGILRKVALIFALLLMHLLDGVLPMFGMVPMELGLEKIFALYLSFTEILSIVENLHESGVQFPVFVVTALQKAKTVTGGAATREQLNQLFDEAEDAQNTANRAQRDKEQVAALTPPADPPEAA
jgi:toxin secretion/phage lysis holin